MKVAIITDQHFGVKKSDKSYHNYFKKFYDNMVIQKVQKLIPSLKYFFGKYFLFVFSLCSR